MIGAGPSSPAAWSDGLVGIEVTLSLHSVHNVQHTQTESYYGVATNHQMEGEIPLTSERPARLSARLDGIISLRVFLHKRGAPPAGDRPVGQLSIPMREMLDSCGQGIYQTWFALDPAGKYEERNTTRLAERFRHALHAAPQSLHVPRVCLSLLDVTHPSDWGKIELEKDRVAFYTPLLVSHLQHLQLTRAYFDILERSNIAEKQRSVRGGGGGSQVPEAGHNRPDLERTLQKRDRERAEIEKLKQELDQRTEEANRCIERGNESIIKLKAELKQVRDEEAPALQREVDEAERRLEAAREQGHELRRRVERSEVKSDTTDEELEQLRQDALVVGRQKAALMKMVQDVYGGDAGRRDAGQP